MKDPPTTLLGILSSVGPSMILSASIVGSGELIMTTTLGAKAGFVALWVIVVSCAVKVCVQIEFGRHAVASGRTTMEAFQALPGPRFFHIAWPIWLWVLVQIVIVFQYGGIADGVAQSLHLALPPLPAWIWVPAAGLLTALLISRGYYGTIERFSVTLMGLFTFFTLACVALLQFTDYRITGAQLAEGFRFRLPPEALGPAVAAFGLTGVGASEIIAYPYWCLEKGYAAFAGPRSDDPAWTRRARGWIRVMYWDAVLSMIVYTLVTAAFYVLGAAVLHKRGEIPEKTEMIRVLSKVYTEAAGEGAMYAFLLGAVAILYSTLFSGTAAWTRTFGDAFSRAGFLEYGDPVARRKWIFALAWIFSVAWAVLGLGFEAPVVMVTAGGIANAFLLLVVVYAAWVFRYRRLPPELRPGRLYDVFLWLSILSVAAAGVLVFVKLLQS